MTTPRSLLHVRGDAEVKPGGDYTLIKTFAGLLCERGHEVTVALGEAADPRGYDVVLTINFDSPFEPCALLRRAQAAKVPVCLYALHHPSPGFAAYLRHGTTGGRRVAALLAGNDPRRYLGLLATARTALRDRRPFSCWRACPTRRLQETLLAGCAVILVSSRLERELILEEFPEAGSRRPLTLVPHAFARRPVAAASRDSQLVVCPGRIESRKNQLTLLRVAHRFPDRRFTFVGNLNPAEHAYGRDFLRMIASTRNARHIAGLDLDGFRRLLAGAGVAASASWFEVVSLAELEALAQGCRLVATRHSYLSEFAGDRLDAFDPASPEDLVAGLTRAFAAADSGPAPAAPATMDALDPERVGDALDAALRTARAGAAA